MTDEWSAWLESAEAKHVSIHGNLSIGRSPKNLLILDSPKVSRRHAIINVQNVGEFWLIDLGSSNGTFLNKRRVCQPMQLSDRDQIAIGESAFVFRQPDKVTDEYRTTFEAKTIREIANVPSWLLVADIEDFTPLSRTMTNDKLATLIGGWLGTCKDVIEAHEGMINKYLGDGFFAFWRDDDNVSKKVAAALAQLKQEQAKNQPRFRLAVHFGLVAIGGMPSMGEESLMGKDVNFVFRMEKLAGSLKILLLTSAAGKDKLGSLIKLQPAGSHELKGFDGKYEFFSG
jgi:adenylate cyclase